jgi:hypothetical protein
MTACSIPDYNIKVYSAIFSIENALRELIIEKLSEVHGPRWYVKRLPSDILKKYKDGIEYERKNHWMVFIPHHPIYYIDFADIKKVVERNDNWNEIFAEIFANKETIAALLSELEPIRNKIAHNRKASSQDSYFVNTAYQKLSQSIGSELFERLAQKCTISLEIPETLRSLQIEAESSFTICKNFQILSDLPNWSHVRKQWWFDQDYLNHNLNHIIEYFSILCEYIEIPRQRGIGHLLETWFKTNSIEYKFISASKQLHEITKVTGGNFNGSN